MVDCSPALNRAAESAGATTTTSVLPSANPACAWPASGTTAAMCRPFPARSWYVFGSVGRPEPGGTTTTVWSGLNWPL